MSAASLGSATGSRVDSAAKHTMACKVDTRYFKGTIENFEDCDNVLKGSRDKYAMQKDEIVMNTSKRLHAASGHTAYPLVITTLGDLNQSITRYLREIYGSPSATQFIDRSSKDFKDQFARDIPPERNADKKVFEVVAAAMPEFRCQGVALGQAFASHLTGDTVVTVLVGGMMTVMNGHFEMFAGTCRARPRMRILLASPPSRAFCVSRVSRVSRVARVARLRAFSRASPPRRRRRTVVFRLRKGRLLQRLERRRLPRRKKGTA